MQAVGKALVMSWVRTDQEYVISVAVFGGRSQGCSWSLWGWSCPFPFQEALLPVLAGGFYVCVRVCVCLSGSIFGDLHCSLETEWKGLRPV